MIFILFLHLSLLDKNAAQIAAAGSRQAELAVEQIAIEMATSILHAKVQAAVKANLLADLHSRFEVCERDGKKIVLRKMYR